MRFCCVNAISLTLSAKLCKRVFAIYLTPPTTMARYQNNGLGNELIAAATQLMITLIKFTFIFLQFTNTNS